MSKNNVPGIYKIVCSANKRIYVGSSVHLVDRLQQHRWHLRKRTHHNPILQASYDKYGAESFHYEVIEKCSSELLIEREQYWIDFYNAASRGIGLNVIPHADRRMHSEESKLRMSLAKLGKKKSPETRQRMSIAQRNRSEEWCKAISEGKKGCTFSDEHRKKLSLAKKGKPRWSKSKVTSQELLPIQNELQPSRLSV